MRSKRSRRRTCLPGKDAFDGPEAFLEDRSAVVPAIVDAIRTYGQTTQVRANGANHFGEPGQRVAQQRRFVAAAAAGIEKSPYRFTGAGLSV